jgi:hypothetical protein
LPGNITPETFDVPVYGQIAGVIYNCVKTSSSDNILTNVLSQIESLEVSGLIVQLEQAGADKGNFTQRMVDAVNVIRNHLEKQHIMNRSGQLDPGDPEYLKKIADMSARSDKRKLFGLNKF